MIKHSKVGPLGAHSLSFRNGVIVLSWDWKIFNKRSQFLLRALEGN